LVISPKLANWISQNKEIILLTLFFGFLYSYISIIKHDHYQTFTWDTGFFDQLIWKVSRLKEPISSFTGLHILGDHFQVVLLFFTPLYWLPDSINLLFSAQAFIAVFSAIPLYLISFHFFKHKLLSLAISLSMIIYTGMQFAILDGFHQSVFSPLFFTLAFYGLVKKSNKLYWLSIIGLLITKEEMALLATAIGISIFLLGYKLKGSATVAISIISFFLIVNWVIPSIQGEYMHYGYGELGYTPEEILKTSLFKPYLIFNNLVSPQVKIKTVLNTFISFGFLPILSPVVLISALQQFTVRFLDTVTVHRWTNLNHYAFPIAAIMPMATVYSVRLILRKVKKVNSVKSIIAIHIVFIAIAQTIIFHGPINSVLKKDFFIKKQWMKNNDDIIRYVPENASVGVTNNLGPHISQRDNFYLIEENNSAEYLLFDLEDGPNKYSPQSYKKTLNIFKNEIKSDNYKIKINIGKAFLLKKNSN